MLPAHVSWKQQLQLAIRSLTQLERFIDLTEQERRGVQRLASQCHASGGSMPLQITPYYLSLCDKRDPACPIRMQCIPRDLEAKVVQGDRLDPLGEKDHEVAPRLIRRYPDRALLLVTSNCATYCRFCTRARMVSAANGYCGMGELEPAFAWLDEHPQVRELLLSGGDPLVASNERLTTLLDRVCRIASIEVIRIGSRVPTVLPMRVDDELVRTLRCEKPVWLMSHFNHPKELTAQAKEALTKLADGGIPVMNQTVMLRGINDDCRTLSELFRGLVAARARPYYLLHADVMQGTSHFRTTIADSIRVFSRLQGTLSGIALPKLIVDVPGGRGKVPIGPSTIVASGQGWTDLKTFRGEVVRVLDVMDDPEQGAL